MIAYIDSRAPAAQASATIQAAPDDHCKECGSADLSWITHNKVRGHIPQGRLNSNDVTCVFVLGCNHCSETLKVVSADKVAASMNEARSLAAAIQEPVMVAEPDNMGIESHYYDIGPARKAFYEGVRAVGARLEAIAKGWDGCNAHGIDSGKGADIGADLRKSFASIGAAPMVADPAGVCQALIDVRHAIQFSHDSVGGIDQMPVMMHHSGTVVEFIDAVLSDAATVKAVPSEALEAAQAEITALLNLKSTLVGALEDARHFMTKPNVLKDETLKYVEQSLHEAANFAAPLADNTGGGE